MRPEDYARRLPMLYAHYDQAIRILEKPGPGRRRKANYRDVLDEWLHTRNFQQTGRAFGISGSQAYQVVYRALLIAERLAASDSPR